MYSIRSLSWIRFADVIKRAFAKGCSDGSVNVLREILKEGLWCFGKRGVGWGVVKTGGGAVVKKRGWVKTRVQKSFLFRLMCVYVVGSTVVKGVSYIHVYKHLYVCIYI